MRSQAIIQLILVAISLVVIFTVIRPQFAGIREDQDEVARFREALSTVGQYNAKLSELRNRADSFSFANKQALDVYVPTSIDVLSVSRDIQEIAERNQILIGSIVAGAIGEQETEMVEEQIDPMTGLAVEDTMLSLDTEVASSLQSRQFTMVGFGTYAQLVAMLQDFERNIYPLRLVMFQFTSDEQSDVYQATAVLETYALPVQ